MSGPPPSSSPALARAVIDATLVVVELPATLLAAALEPLGCRLAPSLAGAPRETRPAVVEFWNVSKGAMLPHGIDAAAWQDLAGALWGGALALPFATFAPALAVRAVDLGRRAARLGGEWASRSFGAYREASLVVPDVQGGDVTDCAALVAGMHTDSPFARVADRALGFGFRKGAACFTISSSGTSVTLADGLPLASFRFTSGEHSGADRGVELERWRRQPLLGVLAGGRLARARLTRTPLEAAVPVGVELDVRRGFAPPFDAALNGYPRRLTAFRQKAVVELGPPELVRAGSPMGSVS